MTEGAEAESRWRRRAAEALTIVVGILLALAADAGRQYVADRGTERDILAALRVEFAVDVQELEADQDQRAQKLAAIDFLSEVHSGAAESPDLDSLAAAVMWTMNWRYYTPSHPVLDDLLTTGRLDLIRSDDLRRALMAFGGERARLAVVEERERDFVARDVQTYLAARLDLESLYSPRTPEQRSAALRALPDVIAAPSFGSLLYLDRDRAESSSSFANTLLEAVFAVQRALGEQG